MIANPVCRLSRRWHQTQPAGAWPPRPQRSDGHAGVAVGRIGSRNLAAFFFGAASAYSAFVIAFNVPNLIRSLVADNAISAAFVPVFVELRETRGEAEAWRVASIVIWMTAIVLGAVSAIFMLAAPLIMQLFVPGRGVSNSLVVSLTQIMFPIVVILGLTGVVTGILNSYNIFGLPAFAPVIWNLVIIGFLLVDQGDIYAYAWGILVATIVQFLVPLPLLRGKARRGLVFSLAWNNPHVKRILKLMIPVTIGLGLININLTIDLAVGSLASADVPSELNFAFRLFMLPQGLFSVAVSAVLFPEISRLAALGDFESFRSRITGGTRTIIFLLLPASLLSIALAVPITRLLFQRGQFTIRRHPPGRAGAHDVLARPMLQRAGAAPHPRVLCTQGAAGPDPGGGDQPRSST